MPTCKDFGLVRGGIFCAAVTLLSASAWAGGRPEGQGRNVFGHVSGGYAFASGSTSDNVDDTWMLTGGATLWPAKWPVGLDFDLGYAKFDLSSNAIDKINQAIGQDPSNSGQVDGGDVTSWQLTVNAIWGPGKRDNGFYVSGGVGAYYLDGKLTQQGLVYYPPICDPWYWWWCLPGGVGPGSVVKGQQSTTEFGWNVGVGYSWATAAGQLYVEAKYDSVQTSGSDIQYMPITVGFRW